MAFRHGISARVYVHNQNMSPYVEEATFEASRALAEIRVLEATAVQRVAGLRDVSLTLAGVYDTDAEGKVWNMISPAAIIDGCFAFLPDGDTAGNTAYLGKVMLASEGADAGDDAVKMPVQAMSSTDTDRGIVLHPLTERTTDSSTASVNNSADSHSGYQAYLECTAISAAAATLTCKIEHCDDNATWVQLVAFTNVTHVTGPTSEKKSATGDVGQYIRVTWTITPGKAATFFVGWMRN